jgi:protein SCO1/2
VSAVASHIVVGRSNYRATIPHPALRAFRRRICQVPRVADHITGIPGRRLLVGLLVILVLAVVPAVVLPTLMCRQADPELPLLGEVPAFSLIDETGQPFTDEALRGHATIVSFLFTRCDLICPVTTMKMEKIQEKTFDASGRVKLMSISVDPVYDTPERLTAYAQRYHANPEQWKFVTGPFDTIHALVEGGFMTSMLREQDEPNGMPSIAHGGYFLLVDPQLHIRGKYDSGDIKRLDQMIHDARFLARTMN